MAGPVDFEPEMSPSITSCEDTGPNNNEVLEAALTAFKGEKRRAGRAQRVLCTATERLKVRIFVLCVSEYILSASTLGA
jgi:hypothetical protein